MNRSDDPTLVPATPAPAQGVAETDDALTRAVEDAIVTLEAIRDDRTRLAALDPEQRQRLLMAAGQVARPGPWEKRKLAAAALRKRQKERRDDDEKRLAATGIRAKRRETVFTTPPRLGPAPVAASDDIDRALAGRDPEQAPAVRVDAPRNCYVCKRDYHELHFFYDALCPPCAELNWRKRRPSADLSGRVALLTGSRVKIGYQAAIMLLRSGAHVIVTTRFPRDAATRYAREDDFAEWAGRLDIHGLDLRHTPSVEAFAGHLDQSLDRLDFIINNACQTVRRPTGFYGHLMTGERQPLSALPAATRHLLRSYEALRTTAGRALREGASAPLAVDGRRLPDAAELSQLALLDEDRAINPQIFPAGELDADLQQVDRRDINSWRLPLDRVSAIELLEVQLVNAVAPFILNARLKPLMLRHRTDDKHIVNVSAMEGQFYRSLKTDKHPHTNMAKAALNMMTRTSASDYVKDGIHMNSVDTGWITDEDPAEIAARKIVEQGFHPPLDIVDGAARIVDPIYAGIETGEHMWGKFLKDYFPTDW